MRGEKPRVLGCTGIHEVTSANIAVKPLRFCLVNLAVHQADIIENMTVDDEQITQAVIVEIKKPGPERGFLNIGRTQAGTQRLVAEIRLSIVAIEPVEFKIEVADVDIK